MDRNEGIRKINGLMKNAKICSLTTVSRDGGLVSRPMAVQQVEFDGDLWFFTEKDSPKTREISDNPHVNVSFESGGSWVSLSGTGELVRNKSKANELWTPMLKTWFPNGPESQDLLLLKVRAGTAEYWESDGKAVSLLKMASSAVTGKPHDMGENETLKF